LKIEMSKENKILILSNIILVGFFLAVVYHYVLGFYLGMNAPFNSFVYPAYKAFCDFIDILPFVKDYAPYSTVTPWIAYFPLAYIIMLPFTLIKSRMIAYLIFASGFMVFLIYANTKVFFTKSFSKLQNFQNIFIITFLSYSVLYSLDKGNLDMLLFIVLALSVYAFKSKRYMLSAILLAVENAIKPFPVIFLLLFLYKKRYKEFFISLALTAIMIIGCFFAFKGTLLDQISVLSKDLSLFKGAYMYGIDRNLGLTFGSSLFMPLKWVFCQVSAHPLMSTVTFVNLYNILWNIVTVVVAFFTWKEKVFWKKISLLTFYMLLMPYLVYDYKLIFLFIPLWLFVAEKEKSKFDLAYTILFGLLFIPKNIVFFNAAAFKDPSLLSFWAGGADFIVNNINWSMISLSVIINPLIMLIFIGLIITEQFSKKKIISDKASAKNDFDDTII